MLNVGELTRARFHSNRKHVHLYIGDHMVIRHCIEIKFRVSPLKRSTYLCIFEFFLLRYGYQYFNLGLY